MRLWKKKPRQFHGNIEVMRRIIAVDPELDADRVEFWLMRLRAGGLRRVLKTFAWMAVIAMAIIEFVHLVLRLAKLG